MQNKLKELKESLGLKLITIAAMAEDRVIGNDNKIPWKMPTDMSRFRKNTSGHHMIMGRKTYESIGRPLPKRVMVVMTSDESYKAPGCVVVHSPEAALEACKGQDNVYVIGGSKIYELFLPLSNTLEITDIKGKVEGDAHFPPIDPDLFTLIEEDSRIKNDSDDFACDFLTYSNKESTPIV